MSAPESQRRRNSHRYHTPLGLVLLMIVLAVIAVAAVVLCFLEKH